LQALLQIKTEKEDVMRWDKIIVTVLAAGVVALWGSYAHAEEFSARLSGFNEIGGVGAGETGAILTDATGTLHLTLDKNSSTIAYTLTYTGPFSSAVQQAHIHFGKLHVAGGIIVWLCQTAAKPSPTAGTPTCPTPSPSATVTGVLTATSVIAVAAQNVTAGDFDAIEDALTSNTAYVNIHTATFGAGEIRGQIRASEEEKKDKDHHD
jgi:hypothetical protein